MVGMDLKRVITIAEMAHYMMGQHNIHMLIYVVSSGDFRRHLFVVSVCIYYSPTEMLVIHSFA
jgi:hypothetical protein